MKAAKLFYNFISGSHMKVIGIGQLNLGSYRFKINRGHGTLDGSRRTHSHKYRCPDSAMHSKKFPAPGLSILFYQLKHKANPTF
jgi:hypothetical protein